MEQRRLLLAVALSLVVLLLWQRFVLRQFESPPPDVPPAERTAAPEAQAPAVPQQPAALPAPPSAPPSAQAENVMVETDVMRATLTTSGARLVRMELKRYRRSISDSAPLELVGGGQLPLALQIGTSTSDSELVYTVDRKELNVGAGQRGEITFTADRPDGLRVEKRYAFNGDGYLFELGVKVSAGAPPTDLGLFVTPISPEAAGAAGHEMAVALAGKHLTQTALKSMKPDPTEIPGAEWVGFAAQYFLAALVADGQETSATWRAPPEIGPLATLDARPDGGSAKFAVYMGPKDRESLAAAGHELSRALDFGWFWFIAVPLLYALRWLFRVTGNYGVSIIVLTTMVKVATIPLTRATFRNMREMQKLQPQMLKLRERYKDDPATLQKEVMELYRRHRLNPFSGCLPMVLQIPIFIGLYNSLMYAIELRHAPFALWINDLSAPDRLLVSLPGIGSVGLPVLTLFMGASMLLQQWLAPQQGDPTQQRMMMIMPVIFTYMFIHFPAGLVLYWLVNNVISIGQQYLMLRKA